MIARLRRWRLAGLLTLAAVLTAGCNLASMAYFLTTGFQEPKEDPGDMKLAVSGQEIKVAILTYAASPRPEFLRVDSDLTGLLIRHLQNYTRANKEKVAFVSPNKIQDYKAGHPNWFLKPDAAGRHLGADKVIYLEVESLSLYEPGSANQLYRGRASIAVKLFDLTNPDDHRLEKAFTCEYPTTRGPIAVDDMPQRQFYLAFLGYAAKHLSWYFAAHPLSDAVGCD